MKTRPVPILSVILLFLSLAAPAWARGGDEDAPFFCSVGSRQGQEAFRVQRDARSSTGWMMIMYYNYRVSWWMHVSVTRKANGSYVIYGRARGNPVDHAVLSMINAADPKDSSVAMHTRQQWEPDRYWQMRAAICRPPAPTEPPSTDS